MPKQNKGNQKTSTHHPYVHIRSKRQEGSTRQANSRYQSIDEFIRKVQEHLKQTEKNLEDHKKWRKEKEKYIEEIDKRIEERAIQSKLLLEEHERTKKRRQASMQKTFLLLMQLNFPRLEIPNGEFRM